MELGEIDLVVTWEYTLGAPDKAADQSELVSANGYKLEESRNWILEKIFSLNEGLWAQDFLLLFLKSAANSYKDICGSIL